MPLLACCGEDRSLNPHTNVLCDLVSVYTQLLGTSFVACMYFANSKDVINGWISQDPVLQGDPTASTKYLRALHYAVQVCGASPHGADTIAAGWLVVRISHPPTPIRRSSRWAMATGSPRSSGRR
jgi:hypothetical protein